jgi:hypothetical protein
MHWLPDASVGSLHEAEYQFRSHWRTFGRLVRAMCRTRLNAKIEADNSQFTRAESTNSTGSASSGAVVPTGDKGFAALLGKISSGYVMRAVRKKHTGMKRIRFSMPITKNERNRR